MIYILLGLILLVYIVRRSNTSDLYKLANITTDEQIKNYDDSILVIKSTKFSCLLLLCALISLVTITLIRHTKIELFFMNYFGTGIFRDDIYIPFAWYALPFFIIIIRGIIIEVNIGDYLKKNYNLTEEEISAKEAVKGLLFKPKKQTAEIETLEELNVQPNEQVNPTTITQAPETPTTTPQPTEPTVSAQETPVVVQQQNIQQ